MVQNIPNPPPQDSDGTTVTPKGGKGVSIGVILAIVAVAAIILYAVNNQTPPA